MAVEALETLLEEGRGGVWYLPSRIEPKSVQAAAKRAGFAAFVIDGKNIARKEQLLNHAALALHFPKDFGDNWDALEECLTDLEWVDADGYVIYYDHIDGLLEDYTGVAWGLTLAYEAIGERRYLDAAQKLVEQVIARFRDDEAGGFFERHFGVAVEQPRRRLEFRPRTVAADRRAGRPRAGGQRRRGFCPAGDQRSAPRRADAQKPAPRLAKRHRIRRHRAL